MDDASELKIADVVTFLAVRRHRSVTAAARDLRVTPSQVSKAVARLEKWIRRPLLDRKARGVAPSEDAERLLPQLEELVERVRALSEPDAAREQKLTIGAPSYLCAAFFPIVVTAIPGVRVRGLEAGAAYMRAYATENMFQAAITMGEDKFPPSWVSTHAGNVRLGLFGSPEVAKKLGASPAPSKLLAYPFITPVYNYNGQFIPGDDACPTPRADRIGGHEAATVGVALELAAASNQLVFGPVLAARTLVMARRLVEIEVQGWKLTQSIYFHANAERVLARHQTALVNALREATREA